MTNKASVNKGGRPTKLNDDVVNKLEYAFSIGGTIEEACFYADISRETYYKWIKANAKLSDRFVQLRLKPILEAKEAVVKAFKRDPKLALAYLERKAKAEFSLRTETDITSNGATIAPTVRIIDERQKPTS